MSSELGCGFAEGVEVGIAKVVLQVLFYWFRDVVARGLAERSNGVAGHFDQVGSLWILGSASGIGNEKMKFACSMRCEEVGKRPSAKCDATHKNFVSVTL